MFPETITTDRLILRRPRMDDAAVIFERYCQDPDVTRYLTWVPHQTISETRDFLAQVLGKSDRRGKRFPWALTLNGDDRPIGMIELRVDRFKAEVGYAVGKDYWGSGYATEALKGVMEMAFAEPTIYRVWAVCNVNHHASARVLEKAGMSKEALLRRFAQQPNQDESPVDALVYAKVRS